MTITWKHSPFLIVMLGVLGAMPLASVFLPGTRVNFLIPQIALASEQDDLVAFNDPTNGVSFLYPSDWGTLPIYVIQDVNNGKTIIIGKPDTWDSSGSPETYVQLQLKESNQSWKEVSEICNGAIPPEPLSSYEGCEMIQDRQTAFIRVDTDAYGIFLYAYQYAAGASTPYIVARSPLVSDTPAELELWKGYFRTVLESLKLKE